MAVVVGTAFLSRCWNPHMSVSEPRQHLESLESERASLLYSSGRIAHFDLSLRVSLLRSNPCLHASSVSFTPPASQIPLSTPSMMDENITAGTVANATGPMRLKNGPGITVIIIHTIIIIMRLMNNYLEDIKPPAIQKNSFHSIFAFRSLHYFALYDIIR